MRFIKPQLIISLLLSMTFFSVHVHGEIYSWINEDGNRVYTDKRPSNHDDTTQSSPPVAGSVNYYTPPKTSKLNPNITPAANDSTKQIHAASASNNTSNSNTDKNNNAKKNNPINETDQAQANKETRPLTEEECQKGYQLNCDQVVNWREYAVKKCGQDARCKNEDYLDGKYRPRTINEMQAVARSAGARKNLRNANIALFLKKEYTQYCAHQAAAYCKNKSKRQCKKAMASFCTNTQDLKDIFNQYDNLTLIEKQHIIAKAKKLSLASGKNKKAYKAILANIIELLIMQATLGI